MHQTCLSFRISCIGHSHFAIPGLHFQLVTVCNRFVSLFGKPVCLASAWYAIALHFGLIIASDWRKTHTNENNSTSFSSVAFGWVGPRPI